MYLGDKGIPLIMQENRLSCARWLQQAGAAAQRCLHRDGETPSLEQIAHALQVCWEAHKYEAAVVRFMLSHIKSFVPEMLHKKARA